jgi:hypothetical protein
MLKVNKIIYKVLEQLAYSAYGRVGLAGLCLHKPGVAIKKYNK